MSTDISANNRRLAKNTLLLYVRMILIMLISLYTSRVVLATLGSTDFGIYNIVGGVVVLFTFLNSAMVSSIQRFLNFELGRKDNKEAKRVFSMSVNCQFIIIALIIVLGETVGLWFINNYLNIPEGRMIAANWIYQLSILSTCVGVFYAPYNAAIIAYEHMAVYAYVSIVEAMLKLAIVFFLIIGNMDKLILFGILTLVVNIIVSVIYMIYCLKKFDICHYIYFEDKKLFKKLMNFSGWSLFGSTASVATAQGINIVQNMFFGVIVNAAMGIANQVNSAIQGLVNNFSIAYRPQIVKFYASNEREYFFDLLYKTSKFTFFIMFIMALPIIICCSDVLDIWLDKVPEHAVTFCQIILVYSLTEAITTPLWMAVQAIGNIKRYQVEISIIKFVALPLSILALYLGAPTETVLWILVIDNALNHVYRLFYLRKNINFSIFEYTKASMWPCFMVVMFSFPIPVIMRQYLHGVWWALAIITITVIITAYSIYLFGLTNGERIKIKKIISNRVIQIRQ